MPRDAARGDDQVVGLLALAGERDLNDVLGAVLIQLALGAIYAWSVFTARLTDMDGVYAFSASQALLERFVKEVEKLESRKSPE